MAAHWESVTVPPSWPNSVVGMGDGDLEARSVAMVGGFAVYRRCDLVVYSDRSSGCNVYNVDTCSSRRKMVELGSNAGAFHVTIR